MRVGTLHRAQWLIGSGDVSDPKVSNLVCLECGPWWCDDNLSFTPCVQSGCSYRDGQKGVSERAIMEFQI